MADLLHEAKVGDRRGDLDGEIVDDHGGIFIDTEHAATVGGDAVHAVFHGVGVERGTVVEGDILPERYAPGRRLDKLPGLREERLDLVVGRQVDKRFENVRVERIEADIG